jgi:hypothetical protein
MSHLSLSRRRKVLLLNQLPSFNNRPNLFLRHNCCFFNSEISHHVDVLDTLLNLDHYMAFVLLMKRKKKKLQRRATLG